MHQLRRERAPCSEADRLSTTAENGPRSDGRVPGLVATLLVARGVRVGRRGRKRQLDLETEYWKLLQTGVGTVAACKLLGIGRKTGYRWRAGNGRLPPAPPAPPARPGPHLALLARPR